YSIFEAKRDRHRNIHPFPSSVDVAHFAHARRRQPVPADQTDLTSPVLGYHGVEHARLVRGLIVALALARLVRSLVRARPAVTIDEDELPKADNIRYLGRKDYADLPACVCGWDVALMPFALNDATRFISPTKTPEYLAAGKPVVSTPITDVMRHYGGTPAVLIADGPDAFLRACEHALELARDRAAWLPEVDALLAQSSWDETFRQMSSLVDKAVMDATIPAPLSRPAIRSSG